MSLFAFLDVKIYKKKDSINSIMNLLEVLSE